MFRKLINIFLFPVAAIGWLLRLFAVASTPTPIRHASNRLADARVRSQTLDKVERAERVEPEPKRCLLPPRAAFDQAAHLLFGVPAPDLGSLPPDVAAWITQITRDEALKISVMPRDWLDDHVHGRRCAPGLRPVSSDAAAALERERRQDEIEDDAYLDELLRCMAPRC
jgi:hypothetical protein